MIHHCCFLSGNSDDDDDDDAGSNLMTKSDHSVHYLDAYLYLVVSCVLLTGKFERGRNAFEREILPLCEKCYGNTNRHHASIGRAFYYYQGLAIFSPFNDSSSLDDKDEESNEFFMNKALELCNRKFNLSHKIIMMTMLHSVMFIC